MTTAKRIITRKIVEELAKNGYEAAVKKVSDVYLKPNSSDPIQEGFGTQSAYQLIKQYIVTNELQDDTAIAIDLVAQWNHNWSFSEAMPKGFVDGTYSNDLCPSIYNPRNGLQVYIDYEDLADREEGAEYRFTVLMPDNDNKTLVQTNDWQAVLDRISEVDEKIGARPISAVIKRALDKKMSLMVSHDEYLTLTLTNEQLAATLDSSDAFYCFEGDDIPDICLTFCGSIPLTAIGQDQENAWLLFDVHGNSYLVEIENFSAIMAN